MPMYRDLLELVPTGEEKAISSLLLWRQLGLWSHVCIKRKLNEMAAEGLIERKRGRYSGRETSLYFRAAGWD
jgi:DNA-binding HxlR family transcriptional regulator